MQKRHRIFIAINLPEDIKGDLAGFQRQWGSLLARWVEPENLHITVVFLGYATDLELGEVCLAVKEVAAKQNGFTITLNKIIYGPDAEKPRMVWVLGEKSPELSALKNELDAALRGKIHYVPEKRGLNPHITLARIKSLEWRMLDLEERPEINETIDMPLEVASIEVMESELKKGGPQYTIIESHELR